MSRIFNRKVLIIVLVVILAGVSIRFLLVEKVEMGPIGGVVRGGLAPVESGLSSVVHSVRGVFGSLAGIGRAQAEKEALNQQIADLQMENNQLRENKQEVERLRRALGFKEANPQYSLLVAQVIARNPTNWFHTITVNRGSDDGVRKFMPVINSQGLVGKVIQVDSHSSEILLITDPEGPAGAVVLVQDTRVPGVVEGMGDISGKGTGMLRMRLIPYNVTVEEGDEVVTSGLGTVFPAGIRIGRVQNINREAEPSTLQQYSLITPEVDFYRLEEVMIITQVSGGR
ncbi:MAG: rod shape-determining protein MreC [Firmicutes bacterium]|nr:rod shape-determining protein MreC [Bacillota bacterium]